MKVLDLFSGIGGFSLGLRALGNAALPQITEMIGRAILAAEMTES